MKKDFKILGWKCGKFKLENNTKVLQNKKNAKAWIFEKLIKCLK